MSDCVVSNSCDKAVTELDKPDIESVIFESSFATVSAFEVSPISFVYLISFESASIPSTVLAVSLSAKLIIVSFF